MDQTVRDYVVEQTHRLMEAFSCSGEAKEAAQAWLAALGTDREAEETESMYRSWRRIWSLWTS